MTRGRLEEGATHTTTKERNNIHGTMRESIMTTTVGNYANLLLFKQRTQNETTAAVAKDCDPRACYDSFCKHWHQVNDIIERFSATTTTATQEQKKKQQQQATTTTMHDDVLAVVSHLDFMITLLLVELQNSKHSSSVMMQQQSIRGSGGGGGKVRKGELDSSLTPCLRYLLEERLLEKLYDWSCTTGRYADAVHLEHCKLYELLLSQTRYQLFHHHQEFLKPLIQLLKIAVREERQSQSQCQSPLDPLETHLVTLLNHLCVCLMQEDISLLEEFFVPSFIIYDVLINYVHRDGTVGQQAREALLLCMLFSQKSKRLAIFITEESSMCALLVTGLGGLYSRLPKFIDTFNSQYECPHHQHHQHQHHHHRGRIMADDVNTMADLILFMNALEFCNAIVQSAHNLIQMQMMDFLYQGFILPVLGPAILQENVNDQISTMLYIELIFRSVSEPGLLKLFIKFLLDASKCDDGVRILDVLIDRLNSNDSGLGVATMILFDTLLSLHCEDLLLELLLKYLITGKHVPLSYCFTVRRIDSYSDAVTFFLNLTPDIMKERFLEGQTDNNGRIMDNGDENSVYGDYRAYLFEANVNIAQCLQACSSWSNTYKLYKWPQKRNNINLQQQQQRFMDILKEFHEEFDGQQQPYDDKKQLDSLQSLGESSGYESFRWRAPNEDEDTGSHDLSMNAMEKSPIAQNKESWRYSTKQQGLKSDWIESDFSQESYSEETAVLGPFLNAIWGKLQTFTSNNMYVNLHLTGLISRLAWYPFTVFHSILLRPDIIITSPQMPSFHQILAILKQQIDAELPVNNYESIQMVEKARLFLLEREKNQLLLMRKGLMENVTNTTTATITTINDDSNALPPPSSRSNQSIITFSSLYDSFRRKRNGKGKNLGQSLVKIFSRKNNNSTTTIQKSRVTTTTPMDSSSTMENHVRERIDGPISTSQEHDNNRKFSFRETSLSGGVVADEIASEQHFRSLPTDLVSLESRSSTANRKLRKYLPLNKTTKDSSPSSCSTSSPFLEGNTVDAAIGGVVVATTTESNRKRDLALCAVLLDEWLKELAAISQEHSVVMIQMMSPH